MHICQNPPRLRHLVHLNYTSEREICATKETLETAYEKSHFLVHTSYPHPQLLENEQGSLHSVRGGPGLVGIAAVTREAPWPAGRKPGEARMGRGAHPLCLLAALLSRQAAWGCLSSCLQFFNKHSRVSCCMPGPD